MKDLKLVFSGDDQRNVDTAVKRIINIARETGNDFRGPIPLPIEKKDGVIVAKNRRSIDIISPNHKMMPELTTLALPSTVYIEMSF